MWIVHQVIFPSTHPIKLHIVSSFQLRTGVVATHAAFWKSYSLKNLMRLSLPLHCALQCFGKLSRGDHFNSVMSVKYEVEVWLHVVARNFKFPIFDLQMRETFTLYLHFNHEYHIFYSMKGLSLETVVTIWQENLLTSYYGVSTFPCCFCSFIYMNINYKPWEHTSVP